MCGICGVYEKGKNNRQLVSEMLDIIRHRGPDASSSFSFGDFTLGHRRLSIIDLTTGDQPIFNESRSIGVIFNGEIYNHLEFRNRLIALGHTFVTSSDTEMLVHAYEEYGTSFFKDLNGIFAFALFDIPRNRLILARDHFGIKPLHYYYRDGLLLFASEQKAMLLHPLMPRELNPSSLHSHLNLRYTQREETLFRHIKRLPAAHFLIFDGEHPVVQRYWQLDPKPNPLMVEEEAIEQMHFYIKQAVQRQLMSDVPLGVYLSGGMDSSTIVQKMHELGVPEINTFTLGFNEPTDEFPDAARVAAHFNTRHETLNLSLNPMQQFPRVLWHAEEPKINLLQGYNMSAFVRPKVKVVLGGLGGDELFAGYDIHKFIYPFRALHHHTPKGLQKLLRWKAGLVYRMQHAALGMSTDEYRRGLQLLLAIGDIERFYLILRNTWDYDEGFYKEIYNPGYLDIVGTLPLVGTLHATSQQTREGFREFFNKVEEMNSLDQVLYTEFHTKMVNDYLLVEDRMSMANSVEERVPFLDLDLVNFGFSIPVHLKIKNNQTKYLFRKAMAPHLPDGIIRKKKWGFSINPYLQFKKDLHEVASRILTEDFVRRQGIFNYSYLKKIMDHKPHPRLRWHYNYLWVVMGIAIWQKMFIETDNFRKRRFDLEDYYE